MDLEKIERNGLEKLGRRIAAGSEQQAERLVQRVLVVLGFRVVCESWGMYIETADEKCGVFFEDMPGFSTSWSSILGKLVAHREFWIESEEDRIPEDRSSATKWTGNPFFGCRSKEEVEIKLDLLGKSGQS